MNVPNCNEDLRAQNLNRAIGPYVEQLSELWRPTDQLKSLLKVKLVHDSTWRVTIRFWASPEGDEGWLDNESLSLDLS